MACSDPPSVAAASVSHNGTYATYTCTSGYSMQGSASISCNSGSWESVPQCILLYQNPDVDNNISVNGTDIPTWLAIMLGVMAGICALLLLTCLIMCCLHMFGCYTGPMVGFGGNHVYPDDGHRSDCCCCRRHRRRRRRSFDSRSSSVVDMERVNYIRTSKNKGHQEPKIAGYNYSKTSRDQKTQFLNVDEAKSTKSATDSGMDSSRAEDSPKFANTVSELIAQEKRNKRAKDLQMWMPHSHNVRNINTSTK